MLKKKALAYSGGISILFRNFATRIPHARLAYAPTENRTPSIMKKHLAALLVAVLTLAAPLAADAFDYTHQGSTLYYSITGTGTVAVTGYATISADSVLEVPDSVTYNDITYSGAICLLQLLQRMHAYAEHGHIAVQGQARHHVRIFDAVGRRIAFDEATGRTPLLPSGIYVVRIGNLPALRLAIVR